MGQDLQGALCDCRSTAYKPEENHAMQGGTGNQLFCWFHIRKCIRQLLGSPQVFFPPPLESAIYLAADVVWQQKFNFGMLRAQGIGLLLHGQWEYKHVEKFALLERKSQPCLNHA